MLDLYAIQGEPSMEMLNADPCWDSCMESYLAGFEHFELTDQFCNLVCEETDYDGELMQLFAPPAFAGEVSAAWDFGAFVDPPYDGAWGAPFAGYPAF